MDIGAWWATVHRVMKSWMWLKQLSTHAQTWYSLQEKFLLIIVKWGIIIVLTRSIVLLFSLFESVLLKEDRWMTS